MAWFICLLAAVFYSYDFFIRVAPSVMMHPLEAELGFTTTNLGFLSAAYFYAYVLFQIPAGVLLDKYNRKVIIPLAMFLCVFGNFLFSHADGFWMAFIARLFMGLGSAFGFIGAAKLASMWLPRRYFSTFIGLTTVLGLLGGFFTDTILASLVEQLGWRQGNEVFTYIGFGIFVLMLIFIKDNKDYLAHQGKIAYESLWEKTKKTGKIALNSKFWAVSLIGGFLFVPINVLATLWGVSFIQAKYGISPSSAASINSMLFIGNAIGCVIVSLMSPYTNRYRLLLVISCVGLAVLSIIVIYLPMPLWLFITCFVLMGVVVGPQLLTFGIGKAVSPKGLTATAVAGVNVVNNLVGALLLPLIGWLLTMMSVKAVGQVHSLGDYQMAFLIIPISVIICIPLCMMLPKHIRE